jgi:EAL domain-containing protein (putative c-di-GMP-specific phosphodiesterase class I)/GGDEF domain-containing protein
MPEADPGALIAGAVPPARPAWSSTGLRLAWVAVAMAAAAWLSRSLSFSSEFSVIWAPAGIAYGAFWVLGTRALAPLVIGIGAWAGVTYMHLPIVAAYAAIASVVGPGVAVWVQHRVLARGARAAEATAPGATRWLGRGQLSWLFTFYGAELLIGAPLSTAIGVFAIELSDTATATSVVELALGYWLLEVLGAVIFAPLWVALSRVDARVDAHDDAHAAPRRVAAAGAEAPGLDIAVFAATMVLLLLCVLLGLNGGGQLADQFLSLYMPCMAACALRRGRGTVYVTVALSASLLLSMRALLLAGAPHGSYLADVPSLFTIVIGVGIGVVGAQVLQAIVDERRRALAVIERAANEDADTGLLNARGFTEQLRRRGFGAPRPQVPDGAPPLPAEPTFAKLGVRLRNYESLLDVLGTDGLREMLDSIAQTLGALDGVEAVGRPEPTRLVALVRCTSRAQLEAVAGALYDSVESRRVAVRGVPIRVDPVVGGALVVAPSQTPPDVLSTAMREIELVASQRAERPVHVAAVDAKLADLRREQGEVAERVRDAIRDGRIVLMAQRIAPNTPGMGAQRADFEVLCRLLDHDGSELQPGQFLPVAGRLGLLPELDRQVVRATFDWFAAHRDAFARTGKCSINVTGPSLSDSGFVRFVLRELERCGLDSGPIAFEVTESAAILNLDTAAAALSQLRERGFRILLDDFGTGLSTFDYLKKMPVDYIKIDGAFIRDLLDDPLDEEIVTSIVRVARRLHLGTIAEYVSSEALRERVAALGVGFSQGWAIGKPIPIAAFFAD